MNNEFDDILTGGVLLALIEGVGILITRWSADQFNMGMHCAVYLLLLVN